MPVNVSFGPAAGLVGQFGFGVGKRQYSDQRDAVERQSKRQMLGDAMQFAGFLQKARAPQQQQQFAMERMDKQAEISATRDERIHHNQLKTLTAQDQLAKGRETWRQTQQDERNRKLEEDYQKEVKKIQVLADARLAAGEKPHLVSAWQEAALKSAQRAITGSGKYADPGEAMGGPLGDMFTLGPDQLYRDKGSGKVTNLSEPRRKMELEDKKLRILQFSAKSTAQTNSLKEAGTDYKTAIAHTNARRSALAEKYETQIDAGWSVSDRASPEERKKMASAIKAYKTEVASILADESLAEQQHREDRARIQVDSWNQFRETAAVDDPDEAAKQIPPHIQRFMDVLEQSNTSRDKEEKRKREFDALFSLTPDKKPEESFFDDPPEDDPSTEGGFPPAGAAANIRLSSGKELRPKTYQRLADNPEDLKKAVRLKYITPEDAVEISRDEEAEPLIEKEYPPGSGKMHKVPKRNIEEFQKVLAFEDAADRRFALVSKSRDDLLLKEMAEGAPGRLSRKQATDREKEVKKTALYRAHDRLMHLLLERKSLLGQEGAALAAGGNKRKEGGKQYSASLQSNQAKIDDLEDQIGAFEKGEPPTGSKILGEEIAKPSPPSRVNIISPFGIEY